MLGDESGGQQDVLENLSRIEYGLNFFTPIASRDLTVDDRVGLKKNEVSKVALRRGSQRPDRFTTSCYGDAWFKGTRCVESDIIAHVGQWLEPSEPLDLGFEIKRHKTQRCCCALSTSVIEILCLLSRRECKISPTPSIFFSPQRSRSF